MIDIAFKEEKKPKPSFTFLLDILPYLILAGTSSQAHGGIIDVEGVDRT